MLRAERLDVAYVTGVLREYLGPGGGFDRARDPRQNRRPEPV